MKNTHDSEGEHKITHVVRPACAFVAFQHDLPTPRRVSPCLAVPCYLTDRKMLQYDRL